MSPLVPIPASLHYAALKREAERENRKADRARGSQVEDAVAETCHRCRAHLLDDIRNRLYPPNQEEQ